MNPTELRHALAKPGPLSPLTGLRRRIEERRATVAVVGLGYVGLPLLVAAGGAGFGLIGVDVDPAKTRSLRERRSYVGDVTDEELQGLSQVQFSVDHRVLVAADVIVIAVPTPLRDGGPDISMVRTAAEHVAQVLRPGQLVVLESTTYPGTTEDVVQPVLEAGGLVAGFDFALAYSPERIDPGTGRTVRETPKLVAGVGPGDAEVAAAFYSAIVDRVVTLSSPRNAEMAKLIENTFRQVNIALVNELATIAPAIGVDIWEALDGAATKPFGYLPFWPGPGVGGHCIAIDPSYLSWSVEQRLGFGIGFVQHARSVNNRMPAYVAGRVGEALNQSGKALRGARVVVLGLAYKPGVDDVRESPALAVLHRLIDAGARCSYHDPYVPTIDVSRRRKGDVAAGETGTQSLESVPLDEATLGAADCVVILTPHGTIDYRAVVNASKLVFDATGVTRPLQSDTLIRL